MILRFQKLWKGRSESSNTNTNENFPISKQNLRQIAWKFLSFNMSRCDFDVI